MELFWTVILFVGGACVGSFLNVLVYRLPRGESIVFPGSHCPRCGRPIRWYDNIPIASWFILRGRCRDCSGRISPRYAIVEFATAVLVSGLYVCYFVLDVRRGATTLPQDWPMFAAHAALLCGLLAASLVDADLWLVPLEVLWVCSIIAVAAAGFQPHPFWTPVGPVPVAMSFAAVPGLAIAVALLRAGFIRPSFADAEPTARGDEATDPKRPSGVAVTRAHGVNPRIEVLREVLFLTPSVILAIAAWAVLHYVPAAGQAWADLLDEGRHPQMAPRLLGAGAAVFGYLIGGLWIWGMRILGTLGFGKEAMGLGDVHILAAVGAATGWIVPSVAFFVAPFFGLLWAAGASLGRARRELPYGPWLAAASVLVMLAYDPFMTVLRPYGEDLVILFGR
ncbi:MAG: prepilin peptidase [Phycisphaerae bacterium]|nr:prepilin peptidase [Phycisphaerae bacterium]